jgi:hypothetical protein
MVMSDMAGNARYADAKLTSELRLGETTNISYFESVFGAADPASF